MSKLSNEQVIARLKDAIDKLEEYQSKEPKSSRRKAASMLITEYREKIRDAAWTNLIERTEALQDLTNELSGIIDKASEVPTVGGAINDINLIVTGVSELLNEE